MLIDRVESSIDNIDGMGELVPVTNFLPPHKMAGFVPYDGVVALHEEEDGDTWTEEEVKRALEATDVPHDEVIGVGENNDPNIDGDKLAYVKFRSKPQ